MALGALCLAAIGWGVSAAISTTPPRSAQTGGAVAAAPRGRPGRGPTETQPERAALRPRQRLAPGHHPAAGPALARIQIPAIGVDAPVIRLGLNADHTLQVPARTDQAGWWSGGAFPGRRGAAVIVGHVDSTVGPAVFFRLRDLRPGDQVRVIPRGSPAVTFTVDRSQDVPKDNFPTREVYTPTRRPTLRLITCTGTFNHGTGHYLDNLIVFAHRG